MNVIQVTSLDDPRVDVYRNVRDADLRGRDKLFMAESELVIRRLLKTPERLNSLLLSSHKFERFESMLEEMAIQIPIYVAELNLISEIAGFHIHRGVLGAGYRLSNEELSIDRALGHLREQSSVVVMATEGITNVDNMGALFRNAAAFSVNGVVLDPTCCDPLYRKAIRVSMGHVLSVPYAVSYDWQVDLIRLKEEWGLTLIGAEDCDHSKPLWELPCKDRVAVILGSEGTGLSASTRDVCDHICDIPMAESVPSVNVAVASAVVLYELQRKTVLANV